MTLDYGNDGIFLIIKMGNAEFISSTVILVYRSLEVSGPDVWEMGQGWRI